MLSSQTMMSSIDHIELPDHAEHQSFFDQVLVQAPSKETIEPPPKNSKVATKRTQDALASGLFKTRLGFEATKLGSTPKAITFTSGLQLTPVQMC